MNIADILLALNIHAVTTKWKTTRNTELLPNVLNPLCDKVQKG